MAHYPKFRRGGYGDMPGFNVELLRGMHLAAFTGHTFDASMRIGGKSYVVLGLIDQLGEATAYDVKVAAQPGLRMFWPLTHTGLYDECQRLASAHMLSGTREPSGRHRTVYRLTGAGRDALAGWLRRPATAAGQLRDLGLVQLYLGADPTVLAGPQLLEHGRHLQTLRSLVIATADNDHNNQGLIFNGLLTIEVAWARFWQAVGCA